MSVEKIAVIGAGPAGRAITLAAIMVGYPTVIEDVMLSTVEDAQMWLERKLEDTVSTENVDVTTRNLGLSCLETETSIENAIREADLIIETVPEELEMKLELFTIFDKFAKPGAIFASTATTLSVADFSDVTVHRERCIGMRFLEVNSSIYRVELVKTPHTSTETVDACVEVARRMKKEVRITADGRSSDGPVMVSAQ